MAITLKMPNKIARHDLDAMASLIEMVRDRSERFADLVLNELRHEAGRRDSGDQLIEPGMPLVDYDDWHGDDLGGALWAAAEFMWAVQRRCGAAAQDFAWDMMMAFTLIAKVRLGQ